MASGYVDKMVSKAGLEYNIQDARILPTSAEVANQVVKVNAAGTGLEYGVVDVSGAIGTHDASQTAHSYIRGLISNEVTAREGAISSEAITRGDADTALGNRVSVFEASGAHDVAALETSVSTIEGKIPAEASSSNQLADKSFVNSSITTNTATFRGTSAKNLTETQFLAWANGLTKTKNDYVFWDTVDENSNTIFKRYKYDGTNWVYEYTLNNSSFTSAQWGTINSGLTATDKTKLDGVAEGANNYVHPAGSGASQASGLYKFSTDGTSHISGVSAVVKADITALGIPAQDTTYSDATTAASGLMSAADKIKLNGVAEGANNYVHPNGTATNVTEGLYKFSTDGTSHVAAVTSVSKADITALGIPAQDTTYTAGTNVTISGTTISATDTTYSDATTSTSGLMSASDKTKLNGIVSASSVTFTLPAISAGGTANVTVSGITANTVGIFGLASTATSTQYAAAAASQLQLTAQTTNQVTIRANGDALAAGVPAVINILG